MMLSCNRSQSGFTLVEAVMVIVITGILAVLASSFAAPLKGYFEALDRAELSGVADTALRRMARELRTALPNSVRVSGSFIEFLPTTTGGRYRKEQDCSASNLPCTGDILDFAVSDTSFDVIGALPSVPVAGEELVVYNTTPTTVYAGANVVELTSNVNTCDLSAARICFDDGMQFLASPGNRFQIISGPVTFACIGNTLWRYSGYARQAEQPTSASSSPLDVATRARLATGVNCAASSFVYTPGVTQRADLVVMRLTLSNNSDSVTLLHQVHVQNVP